ncbi:platelet binding protein GspB [Drosophila willistoni]|uniref:platelet binding protein GspB n=1 Tax=Drosophila willistoni TaxID=7260 RepID=UPI000C26C34C|nr:platelet binding protein GspB [Drosophila willistoni]
MQQVDDPPSLPVGTEVSAKYKGAFCEAKVSKVVRNIKVKVAYKQGLGSGIVSDDAIKAPTGQLRVGAVVEVRHPDRKETVEATITKIQDCSQYTVVFDDGDITTLRRTALCLKSGRHFNESETLDQLPLTHPEHFGNPVVGGRRGRRRGQLNNEDSSDDEDESEATKELVNEKEEHIGKVVCVETETKKKDKEKWFPALVVAPTAQATVRIRVKDEYLVRSFKDGRYYTVPKKEATEFTREVAAGKQDVPAVQAALEFLDSSILPPHWDRDSLFGLSNISSDDEGEIDSDSSDDEPHEEKDRFVAQLYKYMDDRGTPLNKVPSIQSRDVDLYRLFRAVQKRGGYNRVTSQNQWKLIAIRLGFTPCTVSVMNLVKQAYKKFLQPYGDFNRKLGCSMLMTSRNSGNRSKGRSLVRANSVASPKPVETTKTETISKLAVPNQTATPTPPTAAQLAAAGEESENTSESSVVVEPVKKQRKGSAAGGSGGGASGSGASNTANSSAQSGGKVKSLVEKYEEKSSASATTAAAAGGSNSTSGSSSGAAAAATSSTAASTSKDPEGDVPLSKIKAAAVAAAAAAASAAASATAATATTAATTSTGASRKSSSIEKEPTTGSGSNSSTKDTQRSRDASPATAATTSATAAPSSSSSTSAATTKKEKHQRSKQVEKQQQQQQQQHGGPGGKRKKDEITVVEKIDTGDFLVGVGDKLKVNYHEKKSPSSHGTSTYEAKVIEISVQRGVPMYLVHYTGWNNRYDEWVPRERIAENLTKGSKQKTRTVSTSSLNSVGGGAGATSSPAVGAGGQGNSGNSSNTVSGAGSLGANTSTQPPGSSASGHQQVGGKETKPSSSLAAGAAQSQTGSTAAGGQNQSTLVKTTGSSTSGGGNASGTAVTSVAKRGRGRSDSMPPRSTTPSSVASNSSRTKSPAASQLKKRPTRTLTNSSTSNNPNQNSGTNSSNSRRISDASMATESDSDSDEPVRRPKRGPQAAAGGAGASSKESKALGKGPSAKGRSLAAVAAAAASASSSTTSVNAATTNSSATVSSANSAQRRSPSDDDDSDEDAEEEEEPPAQPPANKPLVRSRASTGNRAMSSGAVSSKGRDYDLSEIRSELKGFQPQLQVQTSTKLADQEERKDLVKKESITNVAQVEVVKKEVKMESAKSSSTEMSSEASDSYADEDSQSSDKPERVKTRLKQEEVKVEEATTTEIKTEATTTTASTPKTEIKEEDVKPSLVKASKVACHGAIGSGGATAAGVDIKPPAFTLQRHPGNSSSSSSSAAAAASSSAAGSAVSSSTSAKYTSVIVEKPQTTSGVASKKHTTAPEQQHHHHQGVAGIKKQATSGQETNKKFIEPIHHKEMATLKVEMPAACSPTSSSSSSSSGSSFCSSGTTSSATRSLPDMSKLEISAPTTGPSSTLPPPPVKESKYSSNTTTTPSSSSSSSSSSGTMSLLPQQGATAVASLGGGLGNKLLSSDIYEFMDTEPFEFEKRISPMASGGTCTVSSTSNSAQSQSSTSVITPSPVATSGGPSGTITTARKQALKAANSALQQSAAEQQQQHNLPSVVGGTSNSMVTSASKPKKRGSPLKEATLGHVDKAKIFKLDTDKDKSKDRDKEKEKTTSVAGAGTGAGAGAGAGAGTNVKVANVGATPAATLTTQQPSTSSPSVSSSSSHSSAQHLSSTPFDVLRKSPSFNLNMTALNEELAQTVQETTRALTDALQPPTPSTPPSSSTTGGVGVGVGVGPAHATVSPASSIGKMTTPPAPAASASGPPIVGSPFIETRNVFELSTSNEGSGYSSGESKDNKLEKLENVKILLAGDLDAVKYEQKPSSIADKVLKAISQKKEEVENSKSKPNDVVSSTTVPTSSLLSPVVLPPIVGPPALVPVSVTAADVVSPGISGATEKQPLELVSSNLKLLCEPLKIHTGSLLGEIYRPSSSTNSPETKSLLESSMGLAKNSELSETIQKLECAIQQRKTPVGIGGVGGSSLSLTGTPTAAHTPNSTATVGAGGFSDESMDSTDSERRLVIEDLAEEQTTTNDQKSPNSEATAATTTTIATKPATPTAATSTTTEPVKLELLSSGSKQLDNVQAPIPLKPATNFVGITQPPPLAKLHQTISKELADSEQPLTVSPSISNQHLALGVPIILPEIPVSVVMSPNLIAAAALRHSPGSGAVAAVPTAGSPSTAAAKTMSPVVNESLTGGQVILKPYTAGATATASAQPSSSSEETQSSQASIAAAVAVPPRPFVMYPAKEVIQSLVVAPAASSPLISDPHNESINLLCEETIPGSPAPNYNSKDDQMPATNASTTTTTTSTIPSVVAPAGLNVVGVTVGSMPSVAAACNTLSLSGISPLPPDTPPPSGTINVILNPQQQQQQQQHHQLPSQSTAVVSLVPVPVAAANAAVAAAAAVGGVTSTSAPNSSPDSASQDDSGEDIASNKKPTIELEQENATNAACIAVTEPVGNAVAGTKRKRTRKQVQDQVNAAAAAATSTVTSSSAAATAAGDLQTLGKRRRQAANLQRKITATTTAGSDTDDASDNVANTPQQQQRHSTRQQLLPQNSSQQQQQQLQHHHQQQQQSQLQQQQQQQSGNSNASGVRPCPYNFLVELDPSLSSDQCISILRKQIQDLRKTYTVIKGELAIIDRRRKKMRRREREKKQQQIQSQQQGKVCA